MSLAKNDFVQKVQDGSLHRPRHLQSAGKPSRSEDWSTTSVWTPEGGIYLLLSRHPGPGLSPRMNNCKYDIVIQQPTQMRGFCYFYLSILTQVSSSTRSVIGFFGHNVTLPCRYNTSNHGVLSFCWGRGPVPRFRCSDTIVSSQDGVVPSSESPRYQLLGSAADGDVSLTILDAQWRDAGLYGCRVEIPGWFNDQKANTHLIMEEETVVVGDPTLEIFAATATSEKFEAFLAMENIGRATAIFLSAIIIILLLVFRKGFLPKRPLEHPQMSPVENIYETL
ncbi:uncharacterized protein AB9W97_007027 isoform 2-T2 [Spinachia spinachia]